MTSDSWSSADLYDRFMGRWSRILATNVISDLDPPLGLHWLDVGCGTGSVSEAVLGRADPVSVIAVDPSAEYASATRARLPDSRVRVAVARAEDLPVPDSSVDRVVCGLVLNFVPDASSAVREMRRVLVPGGTAIAYVWDYSHGMQMLRHFWDAATVEDPAASELDEGRRFPLCHPDALSACFAAALHDVTVTGIEVPTVFRDFDDYWEPFLGGQGPAPTYCRSLSIEALDRLSRRLRETLPTHPDGSARLTARAWVAQGRAA